MGIFLRRKHRRDEQERIEREIYQKERRDEELLGRVALFPGSVEEYQKFRGYEVEVVDTGGIDKGASFSNYNDRQLLLNLVDKEGVEALVNFDPDKSGHYRFGGYGLPVRRKSNP